MIKEVCISSTIVFPENINIEIKLNLLEQISMMLSFLKHYQDNIHILLVTNDVKTVSNLLIQKKISCKNYDVLEIKEEELYFCNNSENEHFRYAFSKLDSLKIINNFLNNNKKFNKLIISDIDSIFLDINGIIKYSKKVRTLAAINYRNEQKTNYKFDDMMKKCIRVYWKDFYSKSELAWINSGFIIIEIKLLSVIIISSKSIFDWINNNKSYIKNSADQHYSDEIIFSAIFNNFNGQEINNNKSKIARFFWTCSTDLANPFLLNPIIYPSHIHLPAVKWKSNQYQMSVIKNLGTKKILNSVVVMLLNYWSSKARLYNFLTKSFFYKLYKKIKNFIVL